MTKDFDWTPEVVEKLKALWADGLTAREIAAAMGVATRNAVIGKIKRLGLSGTRKKPKREPKRSTYVFAQRRAAVVHVSEIGHWPSGPVALMDLNSTNCHWPAGDAAPFTFCGADASEGKPYCVEHCRIAYRRPGEYR